jgi:hypothetical protein
MCGCYLQGQFQQLKKSPFLYYYSIRSHAVFRCFPYQFSLHSSCFLPLLPILNHIRPEFGESKTSKFDIFKLHKNFSNKPVILRQNQPSNFYVITSWHVPLLYKQKRPKKGPNLLRFQKLKRCGVEGNKQFKQTRLFMIPAVPLGKMFRILLNSTEPLTAG